AHSGHSFCARRTEAPSAIPIAIPIPSQIATCPARTPAAAPSAAPSAMPSPVGFDLLAISLLLKAAERKPERDGPKPVPPLIASLRQPPAASASCLRVAALFPAVPPAACLRAFRTT